MKAALWRNIECISCKETFEKNSDLDRHIKDDHEPYGKYECYQCGKTFALRWRRVKHQESHEILNTKKCH